MKIKTKSSFILAIVFVITLLAVIVPALPVFAAPSISISPSSGVSGTKVTVDGLSFSSYAGDQLAVYFDNIEVIPNVVAVSGGIIPQTTFVVPDKLVPGNHIVSIKGSPGVILAQAQFYVAQPEIILSRWSATVGSTITATCDGFHAGQTVTFQYYSGAEQDLLSYQTANDIGECTVQFNVPAGTAGSHEILASNQMGDYATAYLEITPSLNINLPVASIGDKVDITGTGFNSDDEVDIILYGVTVAMATTTDRGSFDAVFNVPVIKAGIYSLEIEETAKDIRWIDFTVTPKISVSATAGDVGTTLDVDGAGFEIGALVQIYYDTEEMTTVTADSTGSFSTYFNVPVSVAGPHNIIVTDGLNTKQAVFTMDSTPPPVPDTYVPKPDSTVQSQVTFAWGTVYDPSEPVSYTLQIARTKDFLQPILEKTGLSLSEYTLTKEESLLPNRQFTNYYWRVRATDSASNAGAWSEPVAFEVEPSNTLPQWTDYILSGIGILLVIILVVRIRKDTKLLKTEK
ncbi:MAG: IPT/TIG domain-containing protein [Dehalococcoidales bacterium]